GGGARGAGRVRRRLRWRRRRPPPRREAALRRRSPGRGRAPAPATAPPPAHGGARPRGGPGARGGGGRGWGGAVSTGEEPTEAGGAGRGTMGPEGAGSERAGSGPEGAVPVRVGSSPAPGLLAPPLPVPHAGPPLLSDPPGSGPWGTAGLAARLGSLGPGASASPDSVPGVRVTRVAGSRPPWGWAVWAVSRARRRRVHA